MKKTITRIIPTNEVMPVHGKPSNITNSCNDKSTSATFSAPAKNCSIAAVPNTLIQKTQAIDGISSTEIKNSRTVRPRETRAMNIPTNGDHAIHQAQ